MPRKWYCSSCYEKSYFRVEEKRTFGSDRLRCSSCTRLSVECSVPGCDSMASVPENGYLADFFCAEHSGQIRNFETLDMSFDSLLDYPAFMERRSINARQVSLVGGAAVTAAAVMTPAAVVAAPALAAKLGALGILGAAGTGTAISSLSGAALTSASLAALGGSVAMGAAVVAGAGGAYGAYKGGAIAQGYFGEIAPFDIRLVKEGDPKLPRIVVINGFISNLTDNRDEWLHLAQKCYRDHMVYEVEWESKCLRECAEIIANITSLDRFVVKFGKASASGLKGALAAMGVLGNPFHQAVVKAQATGVLLSDLMGRCPSNHKFIFMGHSLGARVAFYALLALHAGGRYRSANRRVLESHLFGGAVGNSPKEEWSNASRTSSGGIFNYWSANDLVLKHVYKLGMFGQSNPIGTTPIVRIDGIRNINVSSMVSGHTQYVKNAVDFIVVTQRKDRSKRSA